MSCIYLEHQLLCNLSTVFMPKKKKKIKKWCFQQARNPSNQSLLSPPAFLTTKCGFFGEHDLWHSEEKCFAGEQMSLLRCHSTAFQCGQDGSVLEVHEEKILCPERMASVLPLWCWRREVLRLGEVSCLSFPATFFPVERRRKPRPAACFLCVCGRVCNTYCHWFAICQKCFPLLLFACSGFCWPSLLSSPHRYQPWHLLLFFTGWFRYGSTLLASLFPPFLAGWKQLRL